jgi:hypothetical protein|tara:strand:+ start:285 stop:434 length:150 start_codon:yes stop_codon:yes gene_type:complete
VERAETVDIHVPNVIVGDPRQINNRFTDNHLSVNRALIFASVIEGENDK